jgi:hypothetical protein
MADTKAIIKRALDPSERKRKYIAQEIPIPEDDGVGTRRKPRSDQKLSRAQWEQEYRERLKASPAVKKALRRVPPRHAALAVAWLTNGENLKRAALQSGYAEGTARTILNSDPVQELILHVRAFRPSEDQEWIDLLPEARYTLRNLLRSEDDKVRYLAAKDIVDRAEGKARQRVDMTVRDERPGMTDEEMQLAFSIMRQAGTGFAETVEWMRAHPDEVKEWIKANIGEVQEAEVVETRSNGRGKPAPLLAYPHDDPREVEAS